ncbi:MAG: MBL fold metallo-hydrolase [Lentisphaeria bacterium]|nr:MBL fold metallo-hydrolase [Lentisphaeria bacterium]
MKLHIVGSGCPDARQERYGSACLLEVGTDMLMVDCGPATTYKMACMNIAPTAVSHVFLTHHHFDHNVDLPCFVLTRWDQLGPRSADPLPVYGPPPTVAFVEKLLGDEGAFYDDWYARIMTPASQILHEGRGGALPRPGPAVAAQDLKSGDVVEGDGWTVKAIWVHHVEPWLESLAFRVDTDQGSVVFSGDAGPCPELTEFCQGAEVLVVCCAYQVGSGLHPDIATAVTGAVDAGDIARECQPKTIVLTHTTGAFSAPGGREKAIAEVSRGYDGRIVFADELTSIAL